MRTLDIGAEPLDSVIAGVKNANPVSGLTHDFYRYPARFSPAFARALIATCTRPGDLVLDPFVGGGTTLVEALMLGRRAIGTDVSSLAVFISTVKTTPLPESLIVNLERWIAALPPKLNLRRSPVHFGEWATQGYYRNLECLRTWRVRKLLELALNEIPWLRDCRAEAFARCAILRTGQWALDGRKTIPSAERFRRMLRENFENMLAGVKHLPTPKECENETGPITILQASAADLHSHRAIIESGPPHLILTSPPYPGVHVLYHRWQVLGRREAPAPYWIAGKLDGSAALYYTLGDRREIELKRYFKMLESSFRSIALVAGPETIIVQMVAFSEPVWQLPRYLAIMERSGLREVQLPHHQELGEDGRLWRHVPNRKWHANQKAKSPGAREVVLIHKKAEQ
ncbi:MAG: TRM11 family SAM-dependent methyltransferase [Woeseiaceae bacterium]